MNTPKLWIIVFRFNLLFGMLTASYAKTKYTRCTDNHEWDFCKLNACNSLIATENRYKHFIPLKLASDEHLAELQLFVRGERDCHIALTTTDQYNRYYDVIYEILIGGWNNSRTIIRKGKILTDLYTPNVLSSKRPLKINIKIANDGKIYIFLENKLLAETYDPAPIKINYVSFGSFDNAHVQYWYDCLTDRNFLFDDRYMSNASRNMLSNRAFYVHLLIWIICRIFLL